MLEPGQVTRHSGHGIRASDLLHIGGVVILTPEADWTNTAPSSTLSRARNATTGSVAPARWLQSQPGGVLDPRPWRRLGPRPADSVDALSSHVSQLHLRRHRNHDTLKFPSEQVACLVN